MNESMVINGVKYTPVVSARMVGKDALLCSRRTLKGLR